MKKINSLESKYEALSDDELKLAFTELKESVLKENKSLTDVLEDSFAITREAGKRVLGMRHFDVQLIGGMALHEGRIAEMKTGEGKNSCCYSCNSIKRNNGKGCSSGNGK